MPPPQKIRLGDLLIQQGLLTDEQLKIALDEQKRTGRKLGRVFVESGYVTEAGISQALARQLRAGFPKSLDGANVLLPTQDTAIRRALDQWLDRHGVRPYVVGEFEDYALLRAFARAGHGAAPVPDVLLEQFKRDSGLAVLGPARKVRAEFYAISMERKLKHPAVLAISEQAQQIFRS